MKKLDVRIFVRRDIGHHTCLGIDIESPVILVVRHVRDQMRLTAIDRLCKDTRGSYLRMAT
jgi:hypothetical protein